MLATLAMLGACPGERLAEHAGTDPPTASTHPERTRNSFSPSFPDAAFLVSFKIGYEFGDHLSAPLVSAPSNRARTATTRRPEVRAAFFLIGRVRGRPIARRD